MQAADRAFGEEAIAATLTDSRNQLYGS